MNVNIAHITTKILIEVANYYQLSVKRGESKDFFELILFGRSLECRRDRIFDVNCEFNPFLYMFEDCGKFIKPYGRYSKKCALSASCEAAGCTRLCLTKL
ncbi:hypothetical protein AVEN_177030-1 [Araneus ventricosus]|uniref:Uncharacterized protein n=1 Tax=Araneus ventricosus TaxID=182803 RepID=A0A4Y2CSU0_ARAVE|nr:hypothetical protein AVEN_177030-1 [Araneus ventricosus]